MGRAPAGECGLGRLADPGVQELAANVARAAGNDIDAILADLERWTQTLAPTGAEAALARLADDIADTLSGFGATANLVPQASAAPYVQAWLEGDGEARVALLCHHDTVPPSGKERQLRREGGRAYGLGVADMRGGIAVAAHVMRLLVECSRRPFRRLELISASDEEGRGFMPPLFERLHEFDAALCMECGRPDGSVVSARKGARWLRLDATGRSAHAGVAPDKGRSAILALSREVARVSAIADVSASETLTVTQMSGGEGVNSVPAHAWLTVDVRAPTAAQLERLRDEVSRCGSTVSARDLGGFPPMEPTKQVVRLAEAAIQLAAGLGVTIGHTSVGGASDASWAASTGVPTLDGLGPVGGKDHSPQEYVDVDSFPVRCGIVAGLIAEVNRRRAPR